MDIWNILTHEKLAEIKNVIHEFIKKSPSFPEGRCLFILCNLETNEEALLKQVAKELNLGIVTVSMSTIYTPFELFGPLTIQRKGVVRKLKPWFLAEIYKALEQSDGAILFFKWLNHANHEVQIAVSDFIRTRMAGDYKLPDNVYIIASGHHKEEAPKLINDLHGRLSEVIEVVLEIILE